MSEVTCSLCGAQMAPTDRFCTTCGGVGGIYQPAGVAGPSYSPPITSTAPLSTPTAAPSAQTPGIDFTPTNAPAPALTDPQRVMLAHGEEVKRIHEIGRIQRGSGWLEGTLVITDVRILFHARAKNFLNQSTVNREIYLADVRGVGLTVRKGMHPLALVALILGTLIGLMVASSVGAVISLGAALSSFGSSRSTSSPLSLAPLILSMIVLVLAAGWGYQRSKATAVGLDIFSHDVDASPISFSGQVGRSFGLGAMILGVLGAPLLIVLEWLGVYDASDAALAADLERTRALYNEIGALILDLQRVGGQTGQ